jgi:hypothetical protein
MRILKRPSPSSNIPANQNTTTEVSLHDREARYLAARERIFGTSTIEDQTTGETRVGNQSGKKLSLSPTPPQVIRELRGPATLDDGTDNRGFVQRRVNQPKNIVLSPSKSEGATL